MPDAMHVCTEVLVAGPARALVGVVGADGGLIADGVELPDLWHWVYLLERPAHGELGPEGHPQRGIPQPPAPGLRRMFAGGRVQTRRRLRLGEPATRTVEVIASRRREGRSGALTIVTTRSSIEQAGVLAIVDEQDIVYREPTRLPATTAPAALDDDVRTTAVPIDAALLFQFSALTYNAHRIHYDVDYCRNIEDYADLVVHGPLQALLMAGAAHSRFGGDEASSLFSYRLVSPLTLDQGLQVATTPVRTVDGRAQVHAFAADTAGRITATATLDVDHRAR